MSPPEPTHVPNSPSEPVAEPERPRAATTPPLRLRDQRDFRRLWMGRVAGTSANQMLMVALGWQMYDLTGSAWQLGLVGLMQFLPALLLALPAGQMVDRHDRRWLLSGALALQAVVAAVLLVASLGGWAGSGLILLLSVLLGSARSLQMPALQAITPTLVPPALLPRAIAVSGSGMQIAVVGGPALGGVLYALGATLAQRPSLVDTLGTGDAAHLGAGVVYGVCLLLLLLSILAALLLPRRPVAQRANAMSWATLTAGLHFIRQRPVILGAISLDLFAVLLGGATALLPIFARDLLHVGPEGLGMLRAAPAVGAFFVGLVMARHAIERRAGWWLLGAVAAYGVFTIVFALSRDFTVALVALALSGGADMVSVVIRQSLVQLETPDEMRGRVGAVNSVFIGASNQLGEFESGATAALLGPVGSVLLGGFGTLVVVAVWWRLFPALARRDALVERTAAAA